MSDSPNSLSNFNDEDAPIINTIADCIELLVTMLVELSHKTAETLEFDQIVEPSKVSQSVVLRGMVLNRTVSAITEYLASNLFTVANSILGEVKDMLKEAEEIAKRKN